MYASSDYRALGLSDMPDGTPGPSEFVGPAFVGPDFDGPDLVGPDFVGPDFVGPAFVGPDFVGPAFVGPAYDTQPFQGVGPMYREPLG